LADLDIAAGLIRLGARIAANDVGAGVNTVTFGGPIRLEGINQFISTGAIGSGNNVTFAGTINADDAAANDRALFVSSNAGTIHLQGAVGNLQPLTGFSLNALNGVIRLGANVTITDGTTANSIGLTGAIQLDANVVITTDGPAADHHLFLQG